MKKRSSFLLPSLSILIAACGPEAPKPAATPVAPAAAAPPPPVAEAPAPPEPTPKVRLPGDTRPTGESIALRIDPSKDGFSGTADISIVLDHPRNVIWLHGKGLHVVRATASAEGVADVTGTWEQKDESGFASVTFPRAIPGGKAKLHFEFDAPFGTKLAGLHKLSQAGIPYAFTQFEAIDARTAFPCFDEPGFKIPWDTTLIVPKGDEAIANTKEIERKSDGDSIRVHYSPTPPLPSYLVAFAVGPLDVVAAPDVPPNAFRKHPLPLRGVTVKGRGKEIAYAIAHTGEIITLLEQLFGSEYPYDKLDMIAVPDKPGAMENPGAVMFTDAPLLFDEKTASLDQLQWYAEVVAHELAHQWTGDLVTAAWWDDIWLNESFATWAQAKVAEQWDPKGEYLLRLLDGVQNAMGSDSLVSAREIRQPIESTNDIENAFDGITYQKGAGVLSMFERWVGPEVFQRGLQNYLSQHRFGNATADDFLTAESAAAGKDMKTPFHTFLDQPGIPFIEAEVSCEGAPRLHLKQSRYLPLGSKGDTQKTWQVPVCARFQSGKEVKEACTLLADREGDLALGAVCPKWVMPNADGTGYFRFSLAPKDLANLREHGLSQLSTRERLAYANSIRAGFNRGVLPFKEAFDALAPFASDSHETLASESMGFLGMARTWLYEDVALRTAVEARADKLFRAEGAKLGWDAKKGEPQTQMQLRASVLGFLVGTARDPSVRAEAKRRGLAYLGYKKDGAIHRDAVDPNLVGIALSVVGEEADRALWDSVHAQLAKTDDTVRRQELLTVLLSPRSPELTDAVRNLAFDPALRSTEVLNPIFASVGHHETREAGWRWVKENFSKLLDVIPQHLAMRAALLKVPNVFCDREHRNDAETFFNDGRIAHIDGAPRVRASMLEQIDLCIVKRAKQEPSTREFFSAGAKRGK